MKKYFFGLLLDIIPPFIEIQNQRVMFKHVSLLKMHLWNLRNQNPKLLAFLHPVFQPAKFYRGFLIPGCVRLNIQNWSAFDHIDS